MTAMNPLALSNLDLLASAILSLLGAGWILFDLAKAKREDRAGDSSKGKRP